MSVDILGLANNAANVVIMAILVLGIYRALQMRGAFVNPAFRSRATWSGFLMLTILTVFVSNYAPVSSSGVLSLVGFLPFIALLLVIFAYADKSVLVAIETDFFHRDTLGWRHARWPVALVFVVSLGAAIMVGNPSAGAPLWEFVVGQVLWLVATAVVLSYCTIALIVGARRSSDRALRRSILLFGEALSTLVFSIVASTPFNQGTLPYVIINQGTSLVAIYLIYRSVMSLSPLGRVKEEISVTSKPGKNDVIPPSHL
jgi:hypothetical protein